MFRLHGSTGFAPKSCAPVRQAGCLVAAWSTSLLSQPMFYVDGSTPFGESGRFPCTGALFLRAAGPSISKVAKLMSVLPAWEPIFLGRRLAFELGCPPGRGKGSSRVTPGGVKDWKVVFCVGGSAPAESCSGSVHSGRLGSGRNPRAKTRIPK